MREKERRLEGRDLLLVGFTLFSMFFGAGNLIFPPNIAAQAGTQTWPAMLGLALSAVGLPVLGVVAVARSGGLDALGSRVHPAFARGVHHRGLSGHRPLPGHPPDGHHLF